MKYLSQPEVLLSKQKIKFTFGFANKPFQIRGNTRAIGLMSILAGKPGSEMIGDIITYYDLI